MKTYTSKLNEDLGLIAKKFGLPSWKYLYQINKNKIGDNPDLLQEGTVLEIPQFDSTGGDEKIEAKGVDPFKYTGGLRYAYPWVPFSISLIDGSRKLLPEFDEEKEYVLWRRSTKEIFQKGTIKTADAVEVLTIDSNEIVFGIKGFPLVIGDKLHVHPDDVDGGSDLIEKKIELKDENGEALPCARYNVIFDGQVVAEGSLDEMGCATVHLTPGNKYKIVFPDFEE